MINSLIHDIGRIAKREQLPIQKLLRNAYFKLKTLIANEAAKYVTYENEPKPCSRNSRLIDTFFYTHSHEILITASPGLHGRVLG